jgi:hypothetical protein
MNPLDFECPRCGADVGQRCRTLSTNRTTDTHTLRWDAVDFVEFHALDRMACDAQGRTNVLLALDKEAS